MNYKRITGLLREGDQMRLLGEDQWIVVPYNIIGAKGGDFLNYDFRRVGNGVIEREKERLSKSEPTDRGHPSFDFDLYLHELYCLKSQNRYFPEKRNGAKRGYIPLPWIAAFGRYSEEELMGFTTDPRFKVATLKSGIICFCKYTPGGI